jgi:hypothetical protein
MVMLIHDCQGTGRRDEFREGGGRGEGGTCRV